MKPIDLFRIAAIGEGFSWLALLLTMYLKYGLQLPKPNIWVGYIHGGLFLFYCLIIAYFFLKEKWRVSICLILFITAFVPFGTFWAEKKYLRH